MAPQQHAQHVNQNKPERRCFECDSRLHMVKDCPHRQKNSIQNIGRKLATTAYNQKPSCVFMNTTATSSQDTHSHGMETPSVDTTINEAVSLHVSVDNMPEIQSCREVVETSVMDKSFDNVHVAAIHHEMADLSYLTISIVFHKQSKACTTAELRSRLFTQI